VTRNPAPAPTLNQPADATPKAPAPNHVAARIQASAVRQAHDSAGETRPNNGNGSPFSDPKSVTNRQLLLWMFKFLSPVKPQVFFACLWLGLAGAIEVLSTRQSGIAIDCIRLIHSAAQRPHFWHWFWTGAGHPFQWKTFAATLFDKHAPSPLRDISIVFVILTGALLALRYLTTVSRSKMSMSMVFYIREAIYDKLQRVGFGFHDAVTSGQLINRALSDLQNVRAFVETAVLTSLDIGLVVVLYIALIATENPWLALLALLPLPLWTGYILRFSKRVQPVAKSVMEAEDKTVSTLTENIAGVHVVKAFATEAVEIGKYNSSCDTFLERVTRRIRMFADFQPVVRTIATVSYLTLFFGAAVLIIEGKLSGLGALLVLGGAMSQILNRLQQVSAINEQYQNAIVSSRRLYEVLVAPPTVPESTGAAALPKGTGAVKFEHVSFGYDPAKPVLHDVSFAATGGSIVAIVGPTGAGKSTLVSLISRFYDPQQGRILVDGIDIRQVSLASLRTQVSFVFQETYLFSDTVAGNIAYGRPGIHEGDIEAAARLAQAHEFIEKLPLEYQTMLGERGSSLSGGQRQRLAIARAILTNPRVLILDDATASVDPETEDLIRRGMRFVMAGRTTFVIAHRISTVRQADLVLVVENGRITQSGTHEQLMAEDGHYREIAAVQLFGDELEQTPDGQAPSHMDRVGNPRELAVEAVTNREEVGNADEV
jgi:ATP-binding cassette subfamily B protein